MKRSMVSPLLPALMLVTALLVLFNQAGRAGSVPGPASPSSAIWYVAPAGSDSWSCSSPSSPCATINAALAKAAAWDFIYVALGTYASSNSYVVSIDKDILIFGGWDLQFNSRVGLSTVSGQTSGNGIQVGCPLNSIAVTIDRFLITNSVTAIDNCYAYLALNNSIVRDNIPNAGGAYQGAAITNNGSLILQYSAVSNNKGTGISQKFSNSNNNVILLSSIIDHNVNTSTSQVAGGIFNINAKITVENSTISSNSSMVPGGVGGIYFSEGTLTINSSTISQNSASGEGGGISGLNPVNMQNSILADNMSAAASPDCKGEITSGGYNVIGNTSGCTWNAAAGDQINTDPRLGALVGKPWRTAYHPLLSASPAIDAGNPAGCTGSNGVIDKDQRDVARVGRCDIGAYEYTLPGSAAVFYAAEGLDQVVTILEPLAVGLKAAVLDSAGSPVNNASVTFNAPDSGASGTFAGTGSLTATVQTTESGIASAPVFTANDLGGAYNVLASLNGFANPAVFHLTNVTPWWYVSLSGNDGASCFATTEPCATITAALGKARPGDTVYVAEGTYNSGEITITKDISLSGGWNLAFDSQENVSIINANGSRGLHINKGVTTALDRFVVQNGFVINDAGGGVKNEGNLTLTRSTIQNNQAGTAEFSTGSAGGIYNTGTLVLDRSSVKNNSTGNHYSSDAGGIMNDGGSVVLNNSTVNNNYAGAYGGGILNNNNGTLVLNNSTVSGNHAGVLNLGGGIHNGFPVSGTVYLNSSTISANIGGGIITYSDTVTLQNTILAGNLASDGTSPQDCIGPIKSQGYNLIGIMNCTFTPAAGDLTDVNPKLFFLMGNPGFHPLRIGSPAIDAGNPAGCSDNLGNPLATDQRGIARLGRCDIGAFEYDPAHDPIQYCLLPVILKPCQRLYFDDFSNPSSGWPIINNASSLLEYNNGEYRILVRNTQSGYGVRPDFQAANYSVSVDMRNPGNLNGSYGIAFGISGDWSSMYTLEIYPNGWYGIYRYDPGAMGVTALAEAYSTAINQGSAINKIKVVRSGDSIKAYANRQLLASVTDGNYAGSRYLGLIVFSYNQPNVDIRFDNFAVYEADCAGADPLANTTRGLLPPSGQQFFNFVNRKGDFAKPQPAGFLKK